MIARTFAHLAFFCVSAAMLGAAPVPSVESKGAFVKIATGPGSVDIPAELNPPQLLYLRKASILRISVTYVARNTDFEAAITVYGGEAARRMSIPAAATVDALKTYYYHFSNLPNAAEFCEAVLANQES